MVSSNFQLSDFVAVTSASQKLFYYLSKPVWTLIWLDTKRMLQVVENNSCFLEHCRRFLTANSVFWTETMTRKKRILQNKRSVVRAINEPALICITNQTSSEPPSVSRFFSVDRFLRANAKFGEIEIGRTETGCWFSAVSLLMGSLLNTETGENDLENTPAHPIGSMYPLEIAQIGWLKPLFHIELEISSLTCFALVTVQLISKVHVITFWERFN